MDDDTNERIKALTGFDPMSDTGRAFKFFYRKIVKAQERQEDLDKTIELTAADVRELKAEWEAAQRKKSKVDWSRFISGIAKKIHDDLELYNRR